MLSGFSLLKTSTSTSLQKKVDGTHYVVADRIEVFNRAHSLIVHMKINSAGKNVYDSDNLHKITFIKNLLEYSDDYSRSVAKNSLWYLDTTNTSVVADNAGFAARKSLMTDAADLKNVNVIIPLNRYNFFEELEN